MSKSSSELMKALAWPGYFVAFTLIVSPAIDYLFTVWPVRAGDVQWRYGSLGILSGFLHTPLLGVVFLLGFAAVLGHRIVIRVVSIACVVLVPLVLIVEAVFALDMLQVRVAVPEEARSVYDTGAAKAAIKYMLMALALAWLGIAGIRATRLSGPQRRGKGGTPDMPLVRPSNVAEPESHRPGQER